MSGRGHKDIYKRMGKQERKLSELTAKVKKLYLHIGALTTTLIADILQRYLTQR